MEIAALLLIQARVVKDIAAGHVVTFTDRLKKQMLNAVFQGIGVSDEVICVRHECRVPVVMQMLAFNDLPRMIGYVIPDIIGFRASKPHRCGQQFMPILPTVMRCDVFLLQALQVTAIQPGRIQLCIPSLSHAWGPQMEKINLSPSGLMEM